MSNLSKRKLYITSGDYEDFVSEKKIKKNIDYNKIYIELNEAEDELFKLLIDYTKFNNLKTTVRVAGGWVRDKILRFINLNNIKNNTNKDDYDDQQIAIFKKDVDIALDDISGKEFALGFNMWLQTYHNYPKHSVGIINRDPEKSKHLETATLSWNDISIDFVGLRSEIYTLESRIPIVSLGTAEEDAFRRDFTINSIFYNLNERKIEDLTCKGIEDLYNKVIRTPLDPMKTFLDDPLRALRAFRFTSRLHFKLEKELLNACRDKSLHDALQTKISRERVGSEVHEMISNKHTGNPAIGLRLIVNTNLVDSVFKIPENELIYSFINDSKYNSFSDFGDWSFQGPYLVELTHRIIEALNSDNLSNCFNNMFDSKKLEVIRKLLNIEHESNWGVSTYFSFLLPLFHHYYRDEKSKEVPLAKYILSSSLKLSNKITNSVMKLFDSLLRIVHRVVRIDSLNELANFTLVENQNRNKLKVDIYSKEFLNSIGDSLLPEIWSFYSKYFKSYLEAQSITNKHTNNKHAQDQKRYEFLQRRVELGIFVSYTGNLWLEMLIVLFSLDIIHIRRLKTHNLGCWSDAELLDLLNSHPYMDLIRQILEIKMANFYNFKNPIDGHLIYKHFPQLQKGPKYKFIINLSFLWFMAFSQDPENHTPTEVSECMEFIHENFKETLELNSL
ncbi:tRNA adenylyltransferase [Cryptosporidium ubiquitum]|uniref:tRNA adenylyltransferase n=1 Tax=Cryptosporidium ubiquitum TaxID=857276 RepID=A0A1J4M9H2_9CRYT|nr:tRNA adenylyltransferase [Cryptosporidium ubiquitum]OII70866.1 tRNA adenylyltransferase [Cryptosporidium ubiquitum]